MTAGVRFSACVCAGTRPIVSTVSPTNASEQTAVPPTKKALAADFESMAPRLRTDSPRPHDHRHAEPQPAEQPTPSTAPPRAQMIFVMCTRLVSGRGWRNRGRRVPGQTWSLPPTK
jgi:hypothetical protein